MEGKLGRKAKWVDLGRAEGQGMNMINYAVQYSQRNNKENELYLFLKRNLKAVLVMHGNLVAQRKLEFSREKTFKSVISVQLTKDNICHCC